MEGGKMPCLKIQKECFLFRRKGARSAKQIDLVIEEVSETHCFQSVADPGRGRFLLQDPLEGMDLKHRIRITVAIAKKCIILHVDEKNPGIRRESLFDEAVHSIGRERSREKIVAGFQTDGETDGADLHELTGNMIAIEGEASRDDAE
jgi:hypothetical protein